MKASNIDFGKEIIENYRLKNPLPDNAIDKVIDFKSSGSKLSLVYGNKEYEVIDTTASQQRLIEEIAANSSKVIIRLEAMGRIKATVTILFMLEVEEFEGENSLEIYINSKIEMELIKRRIRTDIVKFFTDQFMLKDMCFALFPEKENSPITLLGDKYICKLRMTAQNILEVYDFSGRRTDIYNDSVTLLRGNIKFIDHIGDKSQLSKEIDKKFKESTKNNEALMKLWTLYSDAEVEIRKKEMEELGTVEYLKYKYIQGEEGKDSVEFFLKKSINKSFVDANFGYAVILDGGRQNKYIGEYAKLSADRNKMTILNINDFPDIPASGLIGGTISGSIVSNNRRQEAQTRINSGKAALTSMKLVLQTGETILTRGKVYKAVDSKLIKQIFGEKDNTFTEKQRQAIDAAINTPDIALIQGPPGTGKTTIIRAIIARLNKIGDGNLKILVTSAQHDAVDNAINNVEYGGLPPNRVGGKFGSDERLRNKKMQQWIYNIQENCDKYLDEKESKYKRELTREIAISVDDLRISKEDNDLVKRELTNIRNLLLELGIKSSIIGEIDINIAVLESMVTETLSSTNELELFQKKLKKGLIEQRVMAKAFLDDGASNLRKLISIINYFDEIKFEIPEYWYDLCDVEEQEDDLEKALVLFEKDLLILESQVLSESKGIENSQENFEEVIENLLDKILKALKKYGEEEIDNTSNSLWQFRDRLDSPVSVQRLIKEYASVNAATCQQAVSVNNGPIIDYDYVIIDEAARANPLDLVIPMSIGKKVILVGDHKQLPHFLEADVVKEVVSIKGDKNVENILKESLFSRLFRVVGEKSGSITKTVFLSEQYRMHPLICKLVNEFYDNGLESPLGNKDKEHELGLYNNKALAWIDVLSNHGSEAVGHTKSLYRIAEIDVILEELEKILAVNDKYEIGVISFYGEQVRKIKERILSFSQSDQERISIGTVDSFQGKEFDVVFLSMVRCNLEGRVGFIDSPNRLNVSFSRAKRLLVCVGDGETVAEDAGEIKIKQLASLMQLCKKEGYYEKR